ncbi:hypothetical protein LOK49_LG04G02513 [Camellia lanceoleosa]|uniref:Uncharacterized protein n=1 Tax=Camellia lanceoleosa TaxID=1840588 RepID=A0ACC0I474_9ERIC|nr:hypothetical protein LOK49_LG04G02513 [Camellia lanceoleosa]
MAEAQKELQDALATKEAEIRAADEKGYAKGAADVKKDYKKLVKQACNKASDLPLAWLPHTPSYEQSKILPNDKDMIRQNILSFIAQVPPLLRVQLSECLKTIINTDYLEQWLSLLQWVKRNLQDHQVFGALFVLRILSRKSRKKKEKRFVYYEYALFCA